MILQKNILTAQLLAIKSTDLASEKGQEDHKKHRGHSKYIE